MPAFLQSSAGLETTLSPAHVVKKGPTRSRGCRPALAIQKLEDVKAVTNQASFRSEPLVPWVASGSDKRLVMVNKKAWREGPID
jgi:hypothetical protein